MCARRARGGQGQYGALWGPESAAAPRPAPVSLCEGHRAGACVSGCEPGGVPWPPVFGALPVGWPVHRTPSRPPRPSRPDPRIGRPPDRRAEANGVQKNSSAPRLNHQGRENRTLHVLHKPDKLTCYLHSLHAGLWRNELFRFSSQSLQNFHSCSRWNSLL